MTGRGLHGHVQQIERRERLLELESSECVWARTQTDAFVVLRPYQPAPPQSATRHVPQGPTRALRRDRLGGLIHEYLQVA